MKNFVFSILLQCVNSLQFYTIQLTWNLEKLCWCVTCSLNVALENIWKICSWVYVLFTTSKLSKGALLKNIIARYFIFSVTRDFLLPWWLSLISLNNKLPFSNPYDLQVVGLNAVDLYPSRLWSRVYWGTVCFTHISMVYITLVMHRRNIDPIYLIRGWVISKNALKLKHIKSWRMPAVKVSLKIMEHTGLYFCAKVNSFSWFSFLSFFCWQINPFT